MERPIREVVEERITHMESLLLDVQEGAWEWRSQITDENIRTALFDIEMAARRLGDLIGRLAPPANE